ncbi:nuclear transport factor 2 family protein [Saccharopolyspora hirsuta]|uniref:Nuclear transport factor 2 family protein n=1 Tax=Saccharopolyspora hirsuta TaxID=1837 RepID=A0A5M7C9F9_SACHI|nr:nuclear transport factor 2 family protein [Saccharopolyspora hirsuta]KAA5834955.1 nuclear transport factor 2 family protein [Saccharopolyspora hirsuta]
MFAELQRRYTDAFNAGDVDALLANYIDAGATVVERGVALSKTGDLRAALGEYFAAAEPQVEFEILHTYLAGDVAMIVTAWSIEELGPDGTRTTQRGRATDVLVREDGEWKFAIDNRFGSN